MGTDIHSVIQVKTAHHGWVDVCNNVGDNRNYDTFAVYADVRSGYGFAGTDTGEGWTPISQPRGFPEDFLVDGTNHIVKIPYRESSVDIWMGDHSYSWLLLSEIESAWDHFKDKFYEVHGVVDWGHFNETLAVGKQPQDWAADVGGKSVVICDQKDVTPTSKCTHVRCKWVVPCINRLSTMAAHMKLMQAIRDAEDLSSENVRIVFGFDS